MCHIRYHTTSPLSAGTMCVCGCLACVYGGGVSCISLSPTDEEVVKPTTYRVPPPFRPNVTYLAANVCKRGKHPCCVRAENVLRARAGFLCSSRHEVLLLKELGAVVVQNLSIPIKNCTPQKRHGTSNRNAQGQACRAHTRSGTWG